MPGGGDLIRQGIVPAMPDDTKPPRPHWPWIMIALLELLQLVSLLPWLFAAPMMLMAFDAPGSEDAWQTWALVLTVWSYPVWLLLAAVVAWSLYFFRFHISSVVVAALMMVPMCVVGTLIAFA